jgi:hypothetical protein
MHEAYVKTIERMITRKIILIVIAKTGLIIQFVSVYIKAMNVALFRLT